MYEHVYPKLADSLADSRNYNILFTVINSLSLGKKQKNWSTENAAAKIECEKNVNFGDRIT